jgi:hypothetical protein
MIKKLIDNLKKKFSKKSDDDFEDELSDVENDTDLGDEDLEEDEGKDSLKDKLYTKLNQIKMTINKRFKKKSEDEDEDEDEDAENLDDLGDEVLLDDEKPLSKKTSHSDTTDPVGFSAEQILEEDEDDFELEVDPSDTVKAKKKKDAIKFILGAILIIVILDPFSEDKENAPAELKKVQQASKDKKNKKAKSAVKVKATKLVNAKDLKKGIEVIAGAIKNRPVKPAVNNKGAQDKSETKLQKASDEQKINIPQEMGGAADTTKPSEFKDQKFAVSKPPKPKVDDEEEDEEDVDEDDFDDASEEQTPQIIAENEAPQVMQERPDYNQEVGEQSVSQQNVINFEGMEYQDITDNILAALEASLNKKTRNRDQKILKQKNPDFDKIGRGLVYSCSGKHWACVNAINYFRCENNFKYFKFNKMAPMCFPENVYASEEDCARAQQKLVDLSIPASFCN